MSLRSYKYEYCVSSALLVVRQSRIFAFITILLIKSILLKYFIKEYYQDIKSVPTLKFSITCLFTSTILRDILFLSEHKIPQILKPSSFCKS